MDELAVSRINLENILWSAIIEKELDPLPKLVLADYYEENGEDEAAIGLRWAAENGKHPAGGDDRRSWYYQPWALESEIIPEWMWNITSTIPPPEGCYQLKHAFYRIGVALKRGRE